MGKDAIDQDLLKRARETKSKSDRDALIVACLSLVVAVLAAFLGKYPNFAYYRDDLESSGHVALVKAADALIARDNIQSPTGYLKRAIWNAMLTGCKQTDPIRFPKGAKPPRFIRLPEIYEQYEGDY